MFYRFIASLRQKIEKDVKDTSPTHKFIRTLRDGGRLMRCYTQNIDGLERRENLSMDLSRGKGTKKRFMKKIWESPRPAEMRNSDADGGCEVVPLHGDLGTLRCTLCQQNCPWNEEATEHFLDGIAPRCSKCATKSCDRQGRGKRGVAVGSLRPNIVLYGEEHPSNQLLAPIIPFDLSSGPEILIIMGTSLKVHGLQKVVREFAKRIHARKDGKGKVIFVNRTRPAESAWENVIDSYVAMDCDDWVRDLRRRRDDLFLRQGEINLKVTKPRANKRKSTESPETPSKKRKSVENPETPLKQVKAAESRETSSKKVKVMESPETPSKKRKFTEGLDTPSKKRKSTESRGTPLKQVKAMESPETPSKKRKSAESLDTPSKQVKPMESAESPSKKPNIGIDLPAQTQKAIPTLSDSKVGGESPESALMTPPPSHGKQPKPADRLPRPKRLALGESRNVSFKRTMFDDLFKQVLGSPVRPEPSPLRNTWKHSLPLEEGRSSPPRPQVFSPIIERRRRKLSIYKDAEEESGARRDDEQRQEEEGEMEAVALRRRSFGSRLIGNLLNGWAATGEGSKTSSLRRASRDG